MYFPAEAILFPIHATVVGNTPYGKRHISRTEPVLVQAEYLRLKRTFTPIFFVQVPDQFDALFNRKNDSEKDAKNITRPSIGQHENVRVLAPPMLFSIGLWQQW